MPETNRQIIRTSSDLPVNHWMRRQLPAETSLRPYGEDRAVSMLTGAVLDAIEAADISRAEIARVLGTTKSYISQVLNGSTNMTLKTLGALLWACGKQVQELRFSAIGANEATAPAGVKFVFSDPHTYQTDVTFGGKFSITEKAVTYQSPAIVQ